MSQSLGQSLHVQSHGAIEFADILTSQLSWPSPLPIPACFEDSVGRPGQMQHARMRWLHIISLAAQSLESPRIFRRTLDLAIKVSHVLHFPVVVQKSGVRLDLVTPLRQVPLLLALAWAFVLLRTEWHEPFLECGIREIDLYLELMLTKGDMT